MTSGVNRATGAEKRYTVGYQFVSSTVPMISPRSLTTLAIDVRAGSILRLTLIPLDHAHARITPLLSELPTTTPELLIARGNVRPPPKPSKTSNSPAVQTNATSAPCAPIVP